MSVTVLINLLVALVILGLIAYVLFWGIGKIGLPEPFNKVAVAVVVLIVVVFLLYLLVNLGGASGLFR